MIAVGTQAPDFTLKDQNGKEVKLSALHGKSMESADMGEGPAAPHPIGKAEFS